MQKNNSLTNVTNITKIIDTIQKNKVAIVVTIIITSITDANCSIMLYDDKTSTCKHDMKFKLDNNETIFIQSKLFLTEYDSLRVKSDKSDTMFTVMYDISNNS